MSEKLDFWSEHARQAYSLPEDWRWVQLNFEKGYTRLTGGVCHAVFMRGKRAGKMNWSKRDRAFDATVTLKDDEHQAFLSAWEATTGLCSNCQGSGEKFKSWSVDDGVKMRTCSHCKGSGKRKDPRP